MALEYTVTKQDVRLAQPRMWRFSVTLALIDDGDGPGFTKTFAANYKKEADAADMDVRLAKIEDDLTEEMQAAVDQYRGERAKHDHAKFTALVVRLNSALNVEA